MAWIIMSWTSLLPMAYQECASPSIRAAQRIKDHFTKLLNAAKYSRSLAFKIYRACFIENVCINVQISLVDLSDDNQRTTIPI